MAELDWPAPPGGDAPCDDGDWPGEGEGAGAAGDGGGDVWGASVVTEGEAVGVADSAGEVVAEAAGEGRGVATFSFAAGWRMGVTG